MARDRGKLTPQGPEDAGGEGVPLSSSHGPDQPPTRKRLDFEPPKQLQVGLGLVGWGCAAKGNREFVFKAVSLCYVFCRGIQVIVLGESPPFSLS